MTINTPPPVGSRIEPESSDAGISYAAIRRFIRRNSKLILIGGLIGATAGYIYCKTASPIYTARARILLSEKPRSVSYIDGTSSYQYTLDTPQIESQSQVLHSEQLSREVIGKLGLLNDPELQGTPGLLSRLKEYLSLTDGDQGASKSDAMNSVIAAFDGRLGTQRLGQSYVIELTFSSQSPTKSAKIVNSLTADYIKNQLEIKVKAAESGSELIERRLADLKKQLDIASAAVATGTIDVETFPSADARVLTAASPPFGPSWPKTGITTIIMGILGFVLAALVAMLRANGPLNFND